MGTVNINGVSREMTADEQAEFNAQQTAWNSKSAKRKLAEIRRIRNQKLSETDYLALSDVVLSDAWKDKRKSWRDIPQDFTTESQYDLLLARDEQGNLTHTIWENA
jgi:predicted ribosome quality control (RQC) complex YloA/Tae2 family protein